ncbi:YveK family protein [Peribacillus sp. SCS-37]|uniref:YveK family protein n=1 Tax=Paraperibacillus esterisolvens TaxID=3115296 RepID=UPI00390591B1
MNHSSEEKSQAKEINLKEIMLVIKRRLLLVIILAVIGTAAGVLYTNMNQPAPLYQASSRIIIDANAESRATLQVIIRDSVILKKVIEQLDLPSTPEQLAGQITVMSIENSQVVNIAVVDTDPSMAAAIANTTAQVFKDEIVTIMGFKGVKILSPAEVETAPINERSNKVILIGLIAGIIGGIGLTFLLDSLDDSLRSEELAEELFEVPVLGRVSRIKPKKDKKKNYEQIVRGESVDIK